MAQKCSHSTEDGSPCRAYAMKGSKTTPLCFLHSDSSERANAVRKGGALRGAQKTLAALHQKRTDALPKVTALANQHGLDQMIVTAENLEDLSRFAAYACSLLLQGKISAPVGQALASFARISVQAREIEAEITHLNLMRQRRTV